MEKAKQLLKDARFKISDISSRVGYSDGNYFGKSFKKYSGFSPSEYRERNTQWNFYKDSGWLMVTWSSAPNSHWFWWLPPQSRSLWWQVSFTADYTTWLSLIRSNRNRTPVPRPHLMWKRLYRKNGIVWVDESYRCTWWNCGAKIFPDIVPSAG